MANILTQAGAAAALQKQSCYWPRLLVLVCLQGFHFLEHCVSGARFWLNDPNAMVCWQPGQLEILHFGTTRSSGRLFWVHAVVSLTARPEAGPGHVWWLACWAAAVPCRATTRSSMCSAGAGRGLAEPRRHAWDPATGEPVGILGSGSITCWSTGCQRGGRDSAARRRFCSAALCACCTRWPAVEWSGVGACQPWPPVWSRSSRRGGAPVPRRRYRRRRLAPPTCNRPRVRHGDRYGAMRAYSGVNDSHSSCERRHIGGCHSVRCWPRIRMEPSCATCHLAA